MTSCECWFLSSASTEEGGDFLLSSSWVRQLGSRDVCDLCGFQRRCCSWAEAPFHLPAVYFSLQYVAKISAGMHNVLIFPCCCPTQRLLEEEVLPFHLLARSFIDQVPAMGMAEVPVPTFPPSQPFEPRTHTILYLSLPHQSLKP